LVSMGCGASATHSGRSSQYLNEMEQAIQESDRYKALWENSQKMLALKEQQLEETRRFMETHYGQGLGVNPMYPPATPVEETPKRKVSKLGGAHKPMLLNKLRGHLDAGLQERGVQTQRFWQQLEAMDAEHLQELLHLAVEKDYVVVAQLTPIAEAAADDDDGSQHGDGPPVENPEDGPGYVVAAVMAMLKELSSKKAQTPQKSSSEPDEDSQLVDAGNLGILAVPQSPGSGGFANRGLTDFEVSMIAQELKKNDTGFKTLNLWNNCISDVGAVRLAEVLEKNSTISNLNLEYNHIGDKGAMRLAQALESNESLQELYLSNNYIGDTGAERLAQALNWNSGLRFVGISSNRYTEVGEAKLREVAENCRENLRIYLDLI